MAIIRSLAMGKARKSAGNLTFRTVRGRTIASEKRGPNTITRADGITIYQFLFAITSRFMAEKRADIDVSFDKTQYGSQSNGFYKGSKIGLEKAFTPLFMTGAIPSAIPMSEILAALTTYATANPESIIRVKKAGYQLKYLTGAWKSSDNPIPYKQPTVDTLSFDGTPIVPGFTVFSAAAGKQFKITGKDLNAEIMFIGQSQDRVLSTFEDSSKLANLNITAQSKTEITYGYEVELESVASLAIYAADGTLIFSAISKE